uniref:MARVEL domain-containing protein n=1 Tax=Panagrellus redivivus TaxID=6233 RepID=A0A7E4V2C1_PANRE
MATRAKPKSMEYCVRYRRAAHTMFAASNFAFSVISLIVADIILTLLQRDHIYKSYSSLFNLLSWTAFFFGIGTWAGSAHDYIAMIFGIVCTGFGASYLYNPGYYDMPCNSCLFPSCIGVNERHAHFQMCGIMAGYFLLKVTSTIAYFIFCWKKTGRMTPSWTYGVHGNHRMGQMRIIGPTPRQIARYRRNNQEWL